MALVKNKAIRHQVLDRCLSNHRRFYFWNDLLKEVNDELEQRELMKISIRTLKYDINEIEEIYNTEILRLKAGNKTYLRYAEKDFSIRNYEFSEEQRIIFHEVLGMLRQVEGLGSVLNARELETMLENTLSVSKNSRKVIDFESNQDLLGLDLLPDLNRHCFNEQVLFLGYKPYHQPAPIWRIFHPWYLKQYNSRWFLFGWDEERDALSNFALDRIVGFDLKPEVQFRLCDIDFEEYFSDIVGVTKDLNKEARDIELIFSEARAPYIETKPLHPMQRNPKRLPDGRLLVRMRLRPNNELKQLLWSFGPDLEEIKGIEL